MEGPVGRIPWRQTTQPTLTGNLYDFFGPATSRRRGGAACKRTDSRRGDQRPNGNVSRPVHFPTGRPGRPIGRDVMSETTIPVAGGRAVPSRWSRTSPRVGAARPPVGRRPYRTHAESRSICRSSCAQFGRGRGHPGLVAAAPDRDRYGPRRQHRPARAAGRLEHTSTERDTSSGSHPTGRPADETPGVRSRGR